MAINLFFLFETLCPVSEGSAAQSAVAVSCLRHFGETQPIQCHLSPFCLGSEEGVAYYFTVCLSWNDSLIRPRGYLLWYCLCLWPLFLIVVYTASFLWRFSSHWKPKSYLAGFLLLFFSPLYTSCKSSVTLTSTVLVFCWANVRRWQPMPHRLLFRSPDQILQLFLWGA